jgi:transcriptional regulator with XRE-family HTH domain
MIRNERQYRITKARVEEFERALEDFSSRTGVDAEDKLWLTIQQEALGSQLEELRSDVTEYEQLRSAGLNLLEINSLDDVPEVLVKARIAIGLTQKELSDRLGLKEQQIQRYEATDYAGASLERIREVMKALGLKLSKGVFLPVTATTLGEVLKRTKAVGLPKEFIQNRILPKTLRSSLRAGLALDEADTQVWALEAAARLGRVFSWPTDTILSGAPLSLRGDVLADARFKVPARTDQHFFAAYTVYAHYLALVLLQCTPQVKSKGSIPLDASVIRGSVSDATRRITLESILSYCWDDLGIAVLPLNDPGAFHGACWRIRGRNVIVLKQRTASYARWIVDLLHEIRHLANKPVNEDVSVVEPEALTKDAPSDVVDEEAEATDFAGEVALGGRAEELAERCVDVAQGKIEWLKNAVIKVANDEHVSVDLLANYMAYRLSLQGENWWGTAQNLQQQNGDPWQIARDFLLVRANFENVNPIDKELLLEALSEPSTYGV